MAVHEATGHRSKRSFWMSERLVLLKGVGVRVGNQSILSHIDLELRRGEIVTLIGPNGAGKTTLVRVVLGLMKSSGSRELKSQIKIGYMPQKLELNPQLPITVKRFLKISGANEQQLSQRMAQTGIEAIAGHPMQSVSGGELQRVLLARALMQNPDLLVLDEPAQGVDVIGQAEMYSLIHKIKAEQGCGVLMISHDLHLVMAQTDRVICLNHHVCCHGHPDHVSHDPAFIELFGRKVSENLAPYTHHHDHEHDLHGNISHKVHAGHHHD
jgi:zinc transport system ATP-binding protein